MTEHLHARLRPWAAMLVSAVLVAIVLVAGVDTAHARADDSGVQIDIIDDNPSPSPSPSSTSSQPPGSGGSGSTPRPGSGGSTGSGGSGGAGGGSSDPGSPADTPSPATTAPGVRMPFVVSALSLDPSSSIVPFGGSVEVGLSVHNLSAELVNARAAIRIENVFGGRLASRTVMIGALEPNEQRPIRVVFEGLGQEGLVKVVAVVTPPASMGGNETSPVTREAWTFLTPWIVIVALLLVGLGVGTPFALRRWGFV